MKNTWQTADKKSINGLKEMLNVYTLDPTMLNYGKYVSISKRTHFHPDHMPDSDRINFCFRFLEASWNYQGSELKNDYLESKKLISAHMKTDRFKKALRAEFNAVRIVLTGFWNEKNVPKKIWQNKWYTDIKGKTLFPLDFWSDEFKTEWKEIDKKGAELVKKGALKDYYIRVKYVNVKFTTQEEKELLETFKDDPRNYTLIRQAIRRTKENPFSDADKFIEYKFKCTGRKIKYDPSSMYSLRFIELAPTIEKPVKF